MPAAADRGAAAFVDTSVWVYAHLAARGDARHATALALVQGNGALVISPQVVAEYFSVMLRNQRPDAWIMANLRAMFVRSRLQPADADVVAAALAARARYGFSYRDCQIVAAALGAGCATLFTEDLQHGQVLDGRLRVVNPFGPAS